MLLSSCHLKTISLKLENYIRVVGCRATNLSRHRTNLELLLELLCYCATVLLCYCATVLLCYCATALLHYCTSVLFSSSLVTSRPMFPPSWKTISGWQDGTGNTCAPGKQNNKDKRRPKTQHITVSCIRVSQQLSTINISLIKSGY